MVLDFLVIGPEWPLRALLRAELLERGYDVFAVDRWPVDAHAETSRAVIIDLHGLDDPRGVLTALGQAVPPQRVLAVTALATLAADDVRGMGFHVIARPARVEEIVAAAIQVLATEPDGPPRT